MDSLSLTSALSFLYLIVFGSLVGYTSYSYLTKAVAPSQVATYAYVNPLIALILGTLLGNEILSLEIIIATLILIGAVVLMIWKKSE